MKVAALTSYLAGQKQVKQVFLLNPNYAYGQEVSRAARSMLEAKRPDLKIVGDDFHPLGQVKDYSPYIAKIKQSGADAVITADFGADLALIVRAAREAGLDTDFYTLNGNNFGVPSAMGQQDRGGSSWFRPSAPTPSLWSAIRCCRASSASSTRTSSTAWATTPC